MSEIMETLEFLEQNPAGHRGSAVQQDREQKKNSPVIPKKRLVERWSTTLDARDLQCLLAVLEQHVLPQMIYGHSPAAVAPLGRLAQPAS